MRKEKKKEETEREPMERLNREYNDIDYFDKLSSLRVDELSWYFSHHKITFKEKKAEKKNVPSLDKADSASKAHLQLLEWHHQMSN